MLRSGVAFVLGKAIPRIYLIKLSHEPVAGDLRQDTGGGNGIAFAIALDQGGVGVWKPFDSQAIDEGVLRLRVQLVQRLVHGAPGRLPDVDLIDHGDIDAGDGVADFSVARDSRVELLPLLFGKLLGVVEAPELGVKTRFLP